MIWFLKSQKFGYYEKCFKSTLYRLLQNPLEFKNKDPVPVVPLALEDCGTCAVSDFIGLNDKEIDDLEFPNGQHYQFSGSFHEKALRTLQGLIRDNIDGNGNPLPDTHLLLTADCIKRFRARRAKEQHEEHYTTTWSKSSPPPQPSLNAAHCTNYLAPLGLHFQWYTAVP